MILGFPLHRPDVESLRRDLEAAGVSVERIETTPAGVEIHVPFVNAKAPAVRRIVRLHQISRMPLARRLYWRMGLLLNGDGL